MNEARNASRRPPRDAGDRRGSAELLADRYCGCLSFGACAGLGRFISWKLLVGSGDLSILGSDEYPRCFQKCDMVSAARVAPFLFHFEPAGDRFGRGAVSRPSLACRTYGWRLRASLRPISSL